MIWNLFRSTLVLVVSAFVLSTLVVNLVACTDGSKVIVTEPEQPSPSPEANQPQPKPEPQPKPVEPPAEPEPVVIRSSRIICEANSLGPSAFVHTLPADAGEYFKTSMISNTDHNQNLSYLSLIQSNVSIEKSSSTALAVATKSMDYPISLVEVSLNLLERNMTMSKIISALPTSVSKVSTLLKKYGTSAMPYYYHHSGILITPERNSPEKWDHYSLRHAPDWQTSATIAVSPENSLPIATNQDGTSILFASSNQNKLRLLVSYKNKFEALPGNGDQYSGFFYKDRVIWMEAVGDHANLLSAPLDDLNQISVIFVSKGSEYPMAIPLTEERDFNVALIYSKKLMGLNFSGSYSGATGSITAQTEIELPNSIDLTYGSDYSPWTHQLVFSQGASGGVLTFDFTTRTFHQRGLANSTYRCIHPKFGPEDTEIPRP